MLIYIKVSKAQISNIIQSGEFLGNIIGKLGREAPINFAVPFAKDVLLRLATNATLSSLDKFERKISG